MASRQTWDLLAQRLYAKGMDMFVAASPPLTSSGARDPKVVALTLLARTLKAMQATDMLIEAGLIVEARTVTRSIHENLFYAAALTKTGEAFVQELENDDISIRRKRAKGLLEFFEKQDGGKTDRHAELEAYREHLWETHGKIAEISMAKAAQAGGVHDAFIAYRELSTDAAHPSAASLSRHVIAHDDPDGPPFTVVDEPALDPLEDVDTLELLCMAVLGVIVAVNETLGGVAAGERLDGLGEEFTRLSTSNKADRENVAS